jgi:hypothetical protein
MSALPRAIFVRSTGPPAELPCPAVGEGSRVVGNSDGSLAARNSTLSD